ncbi:hypothetical protein [Legionella oakridgensis]|uniref:Uncharacterized protein n=2 Tax=Legionella oakridgensis TaxID=29423 RepID=W0BFB0_9GAMM|nr:hypothetical protein [Legionella oakridgensis]AHE67366.1 hypothetical protein Loa_01819 [Legionella oakridgensis ATCC 33761 = DSM 21215]ETO93029.1 hypothetical protein LOR_68c19070 [Legionella oakridgensis RV-2-2007]KTD43436.1 hypothetical protein Loak_0611 [Legionella oakridgensis]STY20427.1 Uncharacterised protein [Legionella longbeachae]
MDEFDLLNIFYEEIKARGVTHDKVFLNIDQDMVSLLQQNFGYNVTLEKLYELADICIANEWLERTTADPYYNFLSLTEDGLKIAVKHAYKDKI